MHSGRSFLLKGFAETLYEPCSRVAVGKAVDMSYDHKPEDEVELARIKNAGGKVTMDGRVNGGLNLSRAIGMNDWMMIIKHYSSALGQ